MSGLVTGGLGTSGGLITGGLGASASTSPPRVLITPQEMSAAYPSFCNLSPGEQTSLIQSVTESVNRACDRILYQDDYDELGHLPGRTLRIRVRQWPIIKINRLMADLTTVLQISYANPTATRGTVSYLTYGKPGHEKLVGLQLNPDNLTPIQFLFSTYTTLQTLADAINAQPYWSAVISTSNTGAGNPINSNYSNWRTADLNLQVGIQDAFQQPANIDAFVRDIGGIPDHDSVLGSPVIRLSEVFADPPRYPDRLYRSRFVYGFGGNPGNGALSPRYGGLRVSYTAGYQVQDVPPDIKRACIEAVIYFMERRLTPGTFKSKTVGKVSYTVADMIRTPLPDWICHMLDNHRRWEIA